VRRDVKRIHDGVSIITAIVKANECPPKFAKRVRR
jgi:hypothetical protein